MIETVGTRGRMQRCLICQNPAPPGRQHCAKHDSAGTAQTLMSAEGVIVNLPSRESISSITGPNTGPDTGPNLTAGNYAPVRAPIEAKSFGAGTQIGEYIVE